MRRIINSHAKNACKSLGISNVNIIIYSNKEQTIPTVGVGGYAPNADWIQIAIDPTKPDNLLKEIIEKIVPLSIYHELNHVARWRTVGYGNNIPETFITEGLAIVFAEKNWVTFKAPWGNYSEQDIKKYLKLIRERSNSEYNHSEWFFGKGKPKWLGYKVGKFIVEKAIQNSGLAVEKLTKMSAGEILELSKVKLT